MSLGEAMASEGPVNVTRRRRTLGAAAQVAGVIGIVVCLLAVVGVVLGRGWAVGTVDEVATGIDSQVARADPLLATATRRAGEVSDVVDGIVALAGRAAAEANPGPAFVEDVRARVAALSERYMQLRTEYAQFRERIVSAGDTLETLDGLVPAISLPQGPREALQDIDARMQELDARVTEVLDFLASNPVASAIRDWASSIAERVRGIADRIDRVEAAIALVQQRSVSLREEVAAKADTAQGVITLGSVGTIVLLLYLALVHAALFAYGAALRRGPVLAAAPIRAPAPAAPTAPPA
jgi:hypothetical protein